MHAEPDWNARLSQGGCTVSTNSLPSMSTNGLSTNEENGNVRRLSKRVAAMVAVGLTFLGWAGCKTPERAVPLSTSQGAAVAPVPSTPSEAPRSVPGVQGALAAEHAALVVRAFAGKSWSEALALLATPGYLAPMHAKLAAAAGARDAGGAAARILLAALDPRAPLLRRLNAYKDDVKAAPGFACAARLHAYAQVSRALSEASREAKPKEMQRRMTQVFSVLSGIALPPQGAASIICAQGYLGGCDARGPTVAGEQYVRTLRGQIDALLLHGTRGCAAGDTLGKLIEAHVAKEDLLAGLLINKEGRADFARLGIKPFPLLDF